MTDRTTRPEYRLGALLICLCLFASGSSNAQPTLREFLVNLELWEDYSLEEMAAFFAEGLLREDAEERALALAGIYRLSVAAPEIARSTFDLDGIELHFNDSNSDVVKQALTAYVQLAPDDSEAEDAVVERARRGGGLLRDWEFIRYLRPFGISSEVAREWLLELAIGPISENKFSAAQALVRGMDVPPRALLPEVMALISSEEYFCDYSLVQFLPKFGPLVGQYLNDLIGLRQTLVEQAALPAIGRSVRIAVAPPDAALEHLDQIISTFN